MGCNEKCSFNACSCTGILISIVIGAIFGLLYAFGLLPGIVVAAWIAFGLAVLAITGLVAGVFVAAVHPVSPLSKCLCKNTTCLLAGIIGTILTTLVLLSVALSPGFLAVIILVAIAAFFFTLMTIGIIKFIQCIVHKLCTHHLDTVK